MFYEICKFYINVLNISIASSFILIIKEDFLKEFHNNSHSHY